MSVWPYIGWGAWELGKRAASNPWFWNVLQLYLYGEQEVELHHLKEAYERLAQGQGETPPAPGFQPQPQAPIGSAQWYEELEHLETELAGWPEMRKCICP